MFFLSLLYLALTIIRPQDYMPGLANVPLLPAVLILAFVLWLFSSAKSFELPQFVILPVFMLVMMFSQVTNGWAGGALQVLEKFGPTVAAFFVLATSCTTRRRVVIVMAVFVLCSVVLSLHGIEQKETGIGWTGMTIGEAGRIRYIGIFNDPNDLGLLFAATFPMAFYLSARGGFLMRIFWLVGAGLLLYATYLTNSRGSMLAVLLVTGLYVWRRRGWFVAAAMGGTGLVVMRMLSSRMDELSPDESSAFGRIDAWYEGLHMFFSRPLFGIGAGNFTDYNYLTAHNSLVLVLAETGWFGYVTWFAFVGYTFWIMLAIMRHRLDLEPQGPGAGQALSIPSGEAPAAEKSVQKDVELKAAWRDEQALAYTLLLSLSGFFAAAFFLSRSYIVVLYLLVAVAVGHYAGARRRYPSLPPFQLGVSWWRWVLIASASIVGLYVLVTVLLHIA
jgi:O-antigen ligase